MTRRDAESLLIFKPVGCYVVRTCHTRPGYALTYRARDCCRHYRISATPTGLYFLDGLDHQAKNIEGLLEHFRTHPLNPLGETLTVAYPAPERRRR
eukprot:m.3377 g.3377  ORF g.3377 m.3377 type:complete len:96 (+) comp3297_c0_seq1:2-289(+)